MLGFLKKLFGIGRPVEEIDPDSIASEQWQADFSRDDEPEKPPRVRFSITSEKAYRAYLENNALCLALNKTNCIAWTEDALYRYQDLDIRGWFRLDPRGGYAAAGFIFRMVDEGTYYMVLVSNKGYFRLDLVRNGVPQALSGWTEVPGISVRRPGPVDFDLEVLCYGSRILLLINELWAGVWDDSSIPEGRIAFAAASYEAASSEAVSEEGAFAVLSPSAIKDGGPAAAAMLLQFNLDSRIEEIALRFENLEKTAAPESRVRLAETFTAMGLAGSALTQLHKAWESRDILAAELEEAEDKVVLAAIQSGEPVRPVKELLLGARLALSLTLWDEAEEYIEGLIKTGGMEKEAHTLKAALLYSSSRYKELIRWAEQPEGAEENFADPAAFYNLLGHASFNTGDYAAAVTAYDRAFALDEKNGHAAKNAAAACELLNRGADALDRYIKAGRVFLAENRCDELGLIVPKLSLLGPSRWEAAALKGKWAFGIENWKAAREELEKAEELRKSGKTKRHAPDPAVYFLQGLLLVREGKRREALDFFERAVKYAPDYPLFRFRLAENRFLLNGNAEDPALAADMEAALLVKKEEESETYGWVHNFAAHLALKKGDVAAARSHLDRAAPILGEVPAVRVNRAVSRYLEGDEEGALAILESKPEEDTEGLMANCAGNLLVRSRRFEEADPWYRRALALAPRNVLYRYNRASCLIEMGRYGEADDVLTGSGGGDFSPESSPDMLELIAFVAAKKGEYKRAEAAAKAALKINPFHVSSLLQLGWLRAFRGLWDEVEEILTRLDELELTGENIKGRKDLEAWMEEALYKTVSCASCGREWKVERNPPRVPARRIYAMPPDELPAGICPGCGKTYCVGCRKDALDESGRFVCPGCGKSLKLTDDGLKALLNDWAKKNRLV